jgi:MFS family permease
MDRLGRARHDVAVSDAPVGSSFQLIRRNVPFRALWTSRAISFIGGSLSMVALILYVADRVGTGTAVALLMLVGELVPVLVSPLAGALADRLEPRRLLIVCELGQGAMMAVIALVLPGLPVLLALIAVKSLFAVVFDPAGRALVPRLVSDSELEKANAALGIGTYGLEVFGPLMAAALLPVLGIRGVLWLDVASFAISAVLLARLPRLAPGDGGTDETREASIWSEARAGMAYLVRHRTVFAIALGFWFVVLCTGLDDVVLVFLAKQTLHAGNSAVSLLYAGVGLGMMAGLLVFAARKGGRMLGPFTVIAGLALSAGGNLLTGLAGAVVVAFLFQAVRGIGISLVDTALPAVVARLVPAHLRGRIFALIFGGVSLAAILSYVAGGAALLRFSPPTVLIAAGGFGVLACAVTALVLRRAPDTADVVSDVEGATKLPDM